MYICLSWHSSKKRGFCQSCAAFGFVSQNCSWQNTASLETFLLLSRSGNAAESCLSSACSILPVALSWRGGQTHRLWREHEKLKTHFYVFLCSPDAELARAEPGPAKNPCSLTAATVQKLSSGQTGGCFPSCVSSLVTSSPSRAGLVWGSSEKGLVHARVCLHSRLQGDAPHWERGRQRATSGGWHAVMAGAAGGHPCARPQPSAEHLEHVHSLGLCNTAEPGKGLWILSGAGGGGRRWEWVRRGCSILAVPKESSLHALDLWLKIKLAPVKIYERSVAEVRGNIWMWLVAQLCPPWDLCLP